MSRGGLSWRLSRKALGGCDGGVLVLVSKLYGPGVELRKEPNCGKVLVICPSFLNFYKARNVERGQLEAVPGAQTTEPALDLWSKRTHMP